MTTTKPIALIYRPEPLEPIATDERDVLANGATHAWRYREGVGGVSRWVRACEGEVSRDGLWVVGGGQWRFGC